MPAPALLLGRLELGLALVILWPSASDLGPSVGLRLDCAVAVEIDQQPHELRSRQRGLQVDLEVDVQLVDLTRRFRIDQSRNLVLGKLRASRAACSQHAPNAKYGVSLQIGSCA